jgi:hypothetical protein
MGDERGKAKETCIKGKLTNMKRSIKRKSDSYGRYNFYVYICGYTCQETKCIFLYPAFVSDMNRSFS